ncbi:MAG: hypothetical protein KDB27_05800 [Planctomycetales bacterium]|nr:hypothetical protein [Planctomycetales bacterium]
MEIADTALGKFIQKSYLRRLLLVVAVLTAVQLFVSPVAYLLGGIPACVAVTLAGAICLGVGVFSITLGELIGGKHAALIRFGFDMTIRMGILLLTCFVVQEQWPDLMQYGFVPWLAVLNMIGLSLEVFVLVSSLPGSVSGGIG